jgi:hypothetical protein
MKCAETMTMKLLHRSLTMLFLLIGAQLLSAQDSIFWYEQGGDRYINWTYHPAARSIKLHKQGNELSEPIIELNSQELLNLSFDILGDGHQDLWYTFIHCDALWNPSELQINEYVNGFTEAQINDYVSSRNTTHNYTHYRTQIPAPGMQLLISGNYLLKVYSRGNNDTLLFTRRFMVFESLVTLSPELRFATDLDARNYYQELRFSIDRSGFYIADPYNDIRVVIRQNGHWETAITTLKPRMVKGDILEYDYDRGNYFSGGNEFRQFDLKSFKYFSPQTARRYRDQKGYHVELIPDERRAFRIYRFDNDINGRMLLTCEDSNSPESESEYAWVTFTLPYEAPLLHGSIYVFGELSGWEYIPEARMDYDYTRKAYTCTILVKQGFYNYQYVFLENVARQGDESLIEGRHSETRNEYYFYVYQRGKADHYDRLIGYTALSE